MKVAIIGASGYVGAELVGLLAGHDHISICDLVVSENSTSCNKTFTELHSRWQGICDLPLQSFSPAWFEQACSYLDAVFLATPHEFSAQWAAQFAQKQVKVFDLSGAYRLKDLDLYPKHYHFTHEFPSLLNAAVYGLAEWNAHVIAKADVVAVAGCYPTASLTALKPIIASNLHQEDGLIVVNGISGVSGAGRKASLATSFNEVSLTPYNILQHRHQPEISQEAGASVVFNPHLAPFKRGLLSTVTLKLKTSVTKAAVIEAYEQAYAHHKLVRIKSTWPKIDDVTHTPFADLFFEFDQETNTLVASCAIDNLLKGAASQAVQCANLSLGLASEYGLVKGVVKGLAS